ncbi:mycofactocin biosynthesis glycosyltransferase MftF [Streptomyces sp. JW3]|uniref:mycofactocin biosynthesis glycosyltransferase MftF n=1 Tax=Streptomyces sp. JW3 TaxID=3456955 RepID=UPI003FA4BFC3
MSRTTAQPTQARLPDGFRIRVRSDVNWHHLPSPDERLLIGGSPLRATRLTRRAAKYLDGNALTVRDRTSAELARRLLDGNLADPEPGAAIDRADLTVIVPVRDRPEQLRRCLEALTDLDVIVVDDASHDRSAVHSVVRHQGARLLVLPDNLGPAGARNAGLLEVTTPYVAFVDSDVVVDAATLLGLAGHFADPALALAGPLVRGVTRTARPRWFERYDAAASSLTLGSRGCSVQVGAAVGWLPSACLVARTVALRGPGGIGGFAADMRVGEDVDVVWRLVEAGWRVRYDPAFQAQHDVRPTMTGWLGRKVLYGSGGAPLAERHGEAVAVARLSPLFAAAAAGILLRRKWSLPLAAAATGWAARTVRQSLPDMDTRGTVAAGLAAKGLGWAVWQESALLLRHWWPATALGCLASRSIRRATATALIVDVIVAGTVDRPLGQPRLGPVATFAGRRLDCLAYGAGLWAGAVKGRSARCLMVEPIRQRRLPAPSHHDRVPHQGAA